MKPLLFLSAVLVASAQPAAPGPRAALPPPGGLRGYISADVVPPPAGYGYGFSYYTAIWPIVEKHLLGFQVGLCGTWIMPDNEDFNQPLLPLGAGTIREHSPERAAKNWSEVFQTIEGGSGIVTSIQFPGAIPKWKVGGTPNGYITTLRSSGWAASSTVGLPREKMGIAQLSNRLLLPPDGVGYPPGTFGDVTGVAWMALPLTPAKTGGPAPVGDQSWTLFLNTKNFKGPTVFWIPDTWTRLSRDYPVIQGRGFDARPARIPGVAIEFGRVPLFGATAADGRKFAKIPRLQFPVDAYGVTYLIQDVTAYAKTAIFDDMKAWLAGGAPASGRLGARGAFKVALKINPLHFTQGSGRGLLPVEGITDNVETTLLKTGDSTAFALKWRRPQGAGTFPQYYEQAGQAMRAIPAARVPADTGLTTRDFTPARVGENYTSPGVLPEPPPRAGPFTTRMLDGSVITYAWYRFADQPALQGLGWTQEEKERLQAAVEKIHAAWAGEREFLPPPSRGTLSKLDPGALVTPPAGLEVGYVPIVLRQEQAPP